MSKIDFYIFRHGQTDWNRRQLLQGRSDIPINSTGEAQAWALIPMLQDKSIDLIISSSLQRALQTG
ncbi:MAG: histidine phosphatase family protein, partial [Deferribacteraceae bacterium]|nr:histidine phosphatase family protein [Deferribacteraceae bacterium]